MTPSPLAGETHCAWLRAIADENGSARAHRVRDRQAVMAGTGLPAWLRRLTKSRPVSRRPVPVADWNMKVLGITLARQCYQAGLAGPGVAGPPEPVAAGLAGGLCRQADIESPWLRHWCGQLGIFPLYHRKVWEHCFILQALWEAGALAAGKAALGFAVGAEPLPALLAARGVQVLATDLDGRNAAAQVWRATRQHGGSREQLFHPHLVDRCAFDSRVDYRTADMNRIPADLHGRFDACWSSCAMEHLGSIAHGLRFVESAMRCLRPGGTAVHTMEFNLHAAQSGSLRTGSTVLFEEQDVLDLAQRLREAGHQVASIAFDRGDGLLDGFIDVPPFSADEGGPAAMPPAPHLRVAFRGHVVTSLGIIVRAAE